MAVCLFMGLVLIMMSRDRDVGSVFRKEGLGVVALGWIVAAGVGSLPYLFAGVFTNPVDAYFEAMSGFTTTGSTVLRNIEAVPSSILFWRDFTQWLGGIGIVVLFIAILPQMGVGARHLFRSEIPGAVKEGMSPRIKDTAVLLLGIYLSITTLEVLFLLIGGMSFFDALCHTFGTVATGGFSPRTPPSPPTTASSSSSRSSCSRSSPGRTSACTFCWSAAATGSSSATRSGAYTWPRSSSPRF